MRHLKKVLNAEQLVAVREALDQADFEEGRLSAGAAIQGSKHNLQLRRFSAEAMPLDELIIGALTHHPVVQQVALPQRFLAPLFCKYQPGMRYGAHVDSPIMGGGTPLRTDYSFTLFLNEPADYDGGELCLYADYEAHRIKLPAGDGLFYPTFLLHEVAEVTRGQRLVAVTWCQSRIRDPLIREIVCDLNTAAAALVQADPNAPVTRLVQKSANNLARLALS